MHDQASVSSPTVRFYFPGMDLQVVRREGGWLQVSDPVTEERDWVLEKYLASVDGPVPLKLQWNRLLMPCQPKRLHQNQKVEPIL
jgi:hypothetical protein